MLITNKHVHIEPNIILGSTTLARASNFKYLGIHLDNKLKYNLHLHYIKAKLSQFCGVTYRLKIFSPLRLQKIYVLCMYILFYYLLCNSVGRGVVLYCQGSSSSKLSQ